jgi:hypothetical protein
VAALWAAITILYVGGTPANAFIVPADSEAECKSGVAAAMAEIAKKAPNDMQVVAKCVDIGNLPVTASVFGTAKPATDL